MILINLFIECQIFHVNIEEIITLLQLKDFKNCPNPSQPSHYRTSTVLFKLYLLVQFFLPLENVIENNFKNGSSETESNKEIQAECEDPPYTTHLMNSKLRK